MNLCFNENIIILYVKNMIYVLFCVFFVVLQGFCINEKGFSMQFQNVIVSGAQELKVSGINRQNLAGGV